MLQSFNDRLKGPFTWIVVITISFVFVITGMSFFFTNIGAGSSYVAKVGDNEISSQQLQQNASGATTNAQKRQVLAQMVDQYLVLADAQNHNVQVSKLALQSTIFTNPMFFDKSGKFSSEKLAQIASYVGGMPRLETILSQNITASLIPGTIEQTAFITEDGTNQLKNIYAVSKDIEYIKLTPKDLESDIKPTDAELQKFYNANKAEYVNPAKAKISYYLISKDDFKSKETISDEQIKQYYNENKDLFKNFDDKTKSTIKNIIKNRTALATYNSYTQNVDSIRFEQVSKKLGDSKTADIVDNDSKAIEGIQNSLFFTNNQKYGALPISDDKTVVYHIDGMTPTAQQTFEEVKDKVSQEYIKQKSKELAVTEAQKIAANLQDGKKVSQAFEKATVSSDDSSLPKEFVDFVLANTNYQYLISQDTDGTNYVYKVTKVIPLDSKKTSVPAQVIQAYKAEELNYYLQTVRAEVPVKINAQNI